MHPDAFARMTTLEEVALEQSETDLIIADIVEYGGFNETGCTLGNLGWHDRFRASPEAPRYPED